RFQSHFLNYPDMAPSFALWAEETVWAGGNLRPRKQAIRDLQKAQIVEIAPHYWQFPYLAAKPADMHFTPQEALEALGLPSSREELLAALRKTSDQSSSQPADLTAQSA